MLSYINLFCRQHSYYALLIVGCYGGSSTDAVCMHIVTGFVLEPHVRGTDVIVLEVVYYYY